MKNSDEIVPPTIFERFVGLTHLPYTLSCLFIAVLLGYPGTLLVRYLDSFSVAEALYIPGFVTGSESYIRAVSFYYILTYFFFLLYLYYFIRYFRLKSIDSINELSPLISKKGKLVEDFRIISNPLGALGTSIALGVSFAPSVYRMLGSTLGPISAVHVIISQTVLYFASGTGIWLFFSSILSLRRFAKESIKLKPFSEDPLFGLGPIGSISLAMAIIYFGALALRGFGILASGVEFTPTLINIAFELIMLLLGFYFFFSTIYVFHRKMVEQKEIEKKKIQRQSRRAMGRSLKEKRQNDEETMKPLKRILITDVMKRRVEKIKTWPFDVSVLNRIVAIMISVLTILIARIVLSILRL